LLSSSRFGLLAIVARGVSSLLPSSHGQFLSLLRYVSYVAADEGST
jgi:hypothetical protein